MGQEGNFMHASSMENMAICFRKYIGEAFLSECNNPVVLDIGGANVNGSYRDIISRYDFEYLGADIAAGEGIDIHMTDPYKIPLDDASVDIVISGQAFEHVEFFWLLFEEMARILKPSGLMFLIAPSAGEIHRHPVDCYRFYPDSYRALGKYVGLHVIEVFHDQRGPWKDLIGVFSKSKVCFLPISERIICPSDSNSGEALKPVEFDTSEDANIVKGEQPYLEFMKIVHRKLIPRSYFEIGVREGHSANLAKCPSIGIDPAARLKFKFNDFSLIEATSDEYFSELIDSSFSADLAFIDGMHLFEYALRDFINVERHSQHTSVILIDDIFPNNVVQASRERKTKTWMGDVWKLKLCLEEYRPDLILVAVDTYPSGLLMVAGLDPKNTVLVEKYNEIIKRYSKLKEPNQNIFDRIGSIHPSHPFIRNILNVVKIARENGKDLEFIREKSRKAFLNTHSAARALF